MLSEANANPIMIPAAKALAAEYDKNDVEKEEELGIFEALNILEEKFQIC